ncbi:MAG: hypothetical protein PF483_05935 [Halothiobacillus sp.]|jgi:hypothetical protein|uniref:hypothetical protein n=1 Tax=Halothiobacillus sp. TaxID=1891311 RepID=UPI002AD596F1|nr:hypothetical protein [Halothiobacillus sp.]MDA3876610.1 hypothetical protein [Halothiobacillus sp.]
MATKILSIMPADDWYALISDEDEGTGYEPLTCFALVQTDEDGEMTTEVRPMIWADTAVAFADEIEGFMDLERIEEIGDDELDLEDDDQ